MGQEIERKYLIDHSKFQATNKPEGKLYRQGYLLLDPEKTIRVRATPTQGFITIKGITTGATRAEYEYEIPLTEALELLDKFAISELSKTRYVIDYKGYKWEVDVFHGDSEGLIIAEIELASEDTTYDLPGWITDEVTSDQRYYNSNLTTHPYKDWASSQNNQS